MMHKKMKMTERKSERNQVREKFGGVLNSDLDTGFGKLLNSKLSNAKSVEDYIGLVLYHIELNEPFTETYGQKNIDVCVRALRNIKDEIESLVPKSDRVALMKRVAMGYIQEKD